MGDGVLDVTPALAAIPLQHWPLAQGDPLILHFDAVLERVRELLPAAPRLALDGGPDGLGPYRIIAAGAVRHLKPGGQGLVEIGYDQGESVSALFAEHGLTEILVHKDLNGLDRVISAHHLKDK